MDLKKLEIVRNEHIQHLHLVTQIVTVKINANSQAEANLAEMVGVADIELVELHEMDEEEDESNLALIHQCS